MFLIKYFNGIQFGGKLLHFQVERNSKKNKYFYTSGFQRGAYFDRIIGDCVTMPYRNAVIS